MSPSFQPTHHDWIVIYEEFIAAKRLAGRAARTLEQYEERTRPFVAWLGTRSLDRAAVRRYLATLPHGYAPATLHGHVRAISAWCAWLVEEGVLASNPCRKLAPKLPKHQPAHYTRPQLVALLAVCDARDRAIVLALLDTGLRVAEFLQLRRDRIDWHTGAFTIIGKGDVERPGWFAPLTIIAIRRYLDERTDEHAALWVGTRGPLTNSGLWRVIRRRCIEAGIRADVRRLLHSFRANFGKLYLEQGGDLETLRQLYGHQSIQMTSYYAQLSVSGLAKKKLTVNPLGGLFADA